MFDYQKGERDLKKGDITPYVPLEVIREDQILFPLNGRNLSVKLASAEDFFAFISGAVNAINIPSWSIFMRWDAVNVGLEAGTLAVSQEGDSYVLAIAEPKKAEDFSQDAEDFSADKSASQAS